MIVIKKWKQFRVEWKQTRKRRNSQRQWINKNKIIRKDRVNLWKKIKNNKK